MTLGAEIASITIAIRLVLGTYAVLANGALNAIFHRAGSADSTVVTWIARYFFIVDNDGLGWAVITFRALNRSGSWGDIAISCIASAISVHCIEWILA